MEVSVEQTSELGRKMTVTLPESQIQAQMAPRLKKIAQEARIDGFRRGKVPQNVITKMYGLQVRDEIMSHLIESSYFDALKEQNFNPAGYPKIDVLSLPNTEGFSYTAKFEVYPVVSLDGVDSLQVTQQVATVEESDVDTMIAKLKEQRKTWQIVDRTAEIHDRITIDFSGNLDGENFTDGKSIDHAIELGEGKMIPGFEDNLLGLKVGDTKTFTISFPEDYPHAKLAGKPAQFEIEVKQLEIGILPEVDAEFIQAYGIDGGTVEAFRADVKINLERELKNKLQAKAKTATLTALYEKVALALPSSLIAEEIEDLLKPYKEMAKKNKIDIESFNLSHEWFEAEAKKRVALGLIIGEIIHQNELKVDENKVRAHVEEMSKSYENPTQVVEWYYKDENRLKDVRQMTMEEQVTDWLLAKSSITTEVVDFNAIMNA